MGPSGDGDAPEASNSSGDRSNQTSNQANTDHQTSDQKSGNNLDTQYFNIEDVTKKGKGLVASSRIGKGWRIISEAPFLTTPYDISDEDMDMLIADQLRKIGRDLTLRFFACYNRFTQKPFSGRFKSNALPHGVPPKEAGMYFTTGYINHSCQPNARPSWNPEKQVANVHATRDIEKGEEITVSYVPGTDLERRATLKTLWNIDCECSLCSLSPVEQEKLNACRKEIQILGSGLQDLARLDTFPDECLKDCHRLIQLVEEEAPGQPDEGLATVYEDAMSIAVRHSDQARASVFERRAYAARVICEGADNPETRKIKAYARDPRKHEDFAFFDTWESTKSMIPSGMSEDKFERWLWRQATWYVWFPFGYIMGK